MAKERFLERIRPHAEWKGIETAYLWAWPVISPLALALYQKARHLDTDWIGIAGMFLIAVMLSAIGYYVSTRKRQEDQADDSVAGVLAGLPQERQQQDEMHWKKLYLEENQRRSRLQNEYADAVNRSLQIERVLSTRPEVQISNLQIQILNLIRELGQFETSFGSPPVISDNESEHAAWIAASFRWGTKLGHAYSARFAEEVTKLAHILGAKGLDVQELSAPKIRKLADIESVILALRRLFWEAI